MRPLKKLDIGMRERICKQASHRKSLPSKDVMYGPFSHSASCAATPYRLRSQCRDKHVGKMTVKLGLKKASTARRAEDEGHQLLDPTQINGLTGGKNSA